MTLNDNPRVFHEKRRAVLYSRLNKICNTGQPIIEYEKGVAARLYPSMMSRKKREVRERIIKEIHRRLRESDRFLKNFK